MKSFLNLLKFLLMCLFVMAMASCGGAEDRKVKYLEKGKAYLAEKNYEKAGVEFKNVLQIDPKYAEVYFYMGQLHERKLDYMKALANYKKTIELDPTHIAAKINLSKIFVIGGTESFLKDARKLILEVLQEAPSNSEAALVAATIEYKMGDKLKALSDIESLIKKDVKLVEGISLLSAAYFSKGEALKAQNILTKGANDNKDNVGLRIALSKIHVKNKDYGLAEKYLKEAINIEPENYSLRATLGTFYGVSGQLEKAEQEFKRAIDEDDEDVQRYLLYIHFLTSKVGINNAISELKAAIQRKPDMYGLRFAMAQIYQIAGKKDMAKDVFLKVIAEKAFDPEAVEARNKLAVIFLEENNQADARKYVNQVLEEYPNNNGALLTKGKLSLADFDAISAINSLRTVVKNEPKNAEASLLLAQAHLMNKEYSLAQNELQKAIEMDPVNPVTHLNYANYLAERKNIDESLNVVEKALAYFKDDFELLDLQLRLVANKNDESKVVSILDAMKRSAPQKSEVYLKKGQYYLAKKQFDEAIVEFDEALSKAVDTYPVLKQIVKAYVLQKKHDQVISRLTKRLAGKPDDAVSQLLLGQIYFAQKDIPMARSYINKAISSSPKWPVPYNTLASTYLVEGDSAKAIDVLNQGIAAVSNKVVFYMQIAALYEHDKNYKQAINAYNKLLENNIANKPAQNNLASLLLDHGSDEDVKKALDLSMDFEKVNHPAFKDTLGWAYVKSGDNQKAIEILTAVVKQSPKVAVFQYHLGSALYNIGDKDKARSYLEMSANSEQKFFGKDNAKKLLGSY